MRFRNYSPSRLAGREDLSARLIRLSFAAAVELAWIGSAGLRRACAQEAPASRPGAEDPERLAEQMERAFKALEDVEKQIPRDTFDPKAVVAEVGKDPTRLFEWVRDQTYLVPYRGVLRGHLGVLLDRLGNSLDRALLLERLLREAGHSARLASAALSEADAARLLDGMRAPPQAGTPPAESAEVGDSDQRIDETARRYGLDAAAARRAVAGMTFKHQRLAEELAGRVADQSEALAGLLEKHPGFKRPDLKDEESAARQAAVAALRDHWWVQVKTGGGWSDLDPALPGALPGQPLARAASTVDADQIDEALRDRIHEVVIQVVIERWNEGRLEESPVLTQPLWPCAFIGRRLALHHAPASWPGSALLSGGDPAGKLKAAVLAEREWLPVLSVESERAVQNSFDDAGRITKPKKLPPFVKAALAAQKLAEGFEKGAEAAGKGVGSILSTGRIGSAGKARRDEPEPSIAREPAPKAALTAEWLDYEVRVPGEAPLKIRREIFDLIGPAARAAGKDNVPSPLLGEERRLERGLALLGETEILLVPCRLSLPFAAHLFAKGFLANRQILPELLRVDRPTDVKTLSEKAGRVKPFPGNLLALALARHEWSRFEGDVYLAQPNILSFHKLVEEAPGGELVGCQGFDIVLNDVAVRAGSSRDPFLTRLEQGVLDTNAEALLTEGCGKVENAAEFFNLAGRSRIEWQAISAAEDPAFKDSKLPGDVRGRIRQDIAGGSVVVAPPTDAPLGGRRLAAWWRVHPRTGATLGVGSRGWGQTATEKVLIVALVGELAYALCVVSKNFQKDRRAKDLTLVDDFSRKDHVKCVCLAVAAAGAVAVFFLVGKTPTLKWPAVALPAVFAAVCSAE